MSRTVILFLLGSGMGFAVGSRQRWKPLSVTKTKTKNILMIPVMYYIWSWFRKTEKNLEKQGLGQSQQRQGFYREKSKASDSSQ